MNFLAKFINFQGFDLIITHQTIRTILTLTGINLRETQGKQARMRIVHTSNRPTAARHSNPEPGKESAPANRRMLIRKVRLLNMKQVDNTQFMLLDLAEKFTIHSELYFMSFRAFIT